LLSPPDLIVIGAAALLFFGPDQLPKVARRAGQVVREVQNTSQSFIREIERAADESTESKHDWAADTTERTVPGGPAMAPGARATQVRASYGGSEIVEPTYAATGPVYPAMPTEPETPAFEPAGVESPHDAAVVTRSTPRDEDEPRR